MYVKTKGSTAINCLWFLLNFFLIPRVIHLIAVHFIKTAGISPVLFCYQDDLGTAVFFCLLFQGAEQSISDTALTAGFIHNHIFKYHERAAVTIKFLTDHTHHRSDKPVIFLCTQKDMGICFFKASKLAFHGFDIGGLSPELVIKPGKLWHVGKSHFSYFHGYSIRPSSSSCILSPASFSSGVLVGSGVSK